MEQRADATLEEANELWAFAQVRTFQVLRHEAADGGELAGLEPMLHDDDRGQLRKLARSRGLCQSMNSGSMPM
jgi:hypothetical protein